MDQREIEEAVLKIIEPYVQNADALQSIGSSSQILDDLDVNSAMVIDIVLEVEDRFDISIEDEYIDGAVTIGDLVNLVGTRLH